MGILNQDPSLCSLASPAIIPILDLVGEYNLCAHHPTWSPSKPYSSSQIPRHRSGNAINLSDKTPVNSTATSRTRSWPRTRPKPSSSKPTAAPSATPHKQSKPRKTSASLHANSSARGNSIIDLSHPRHNARIESGVGEGGDY